MKLYIPTCTLNFNNIFTTESISPATFYTKRDFGNKRFFKVEANGLDNVVMLYSKYPHFHVESGDIENYPLVLEIETNDYSPNKFYKTNSIDGVDVFIADTTVYFNPYRLIVYFQSYQDLQSTLTKAEQSLENKYSKLYKSSFVVRREKPRSLTTLFSEQDYFDWNPSYNAGAYDIPLRWSDEDAFIDRLKGAITCYLIGANMSVSKEVSRLKQLGRMMKNTLSSIVNSPDKKPTDAQDETLLSCINEFNRIYSDIDDNSLYNRAIIERNLVSPSTGLDKATLLKVLKDLRLEDVFERQLHLRQVYDAQDLYSCLYAASPADAYNVVIERLFYAIRQIESKEQAKANKKKVGDVINVENNLVSIIDSSVRKSVFLNELLNSQIKHEYKEFMAKNGTEELLSIAFVGGGKLKTFMPEKWEGSEYQKYINGLLANLQQGVSFDLFSLDNEILQSFAAFCQKGEDVDRLIDYMLQCGFSDYRIALGILGATRGFASLPKTFTATLIDGDRTYYSEFYKTLYQWLYGVAFENAVFTRDENDTPLGGLDKSIPSQLMESINKIEPKQGKQDAVVRAISQTASLEDAVQSPKAFMFILDSLDKNITRTKAYISLKEAGFENDTTLYTPTEFRNKIYSIIGPKALKGQKQKIDIAIELEAKRQDPEAFLYILDNFLDKTSSAYKKIALVLGQTKREIAPKEASLFDFQQPLRATMFKGSATTSGEALPRLLSISGLSMNVQNRLDENWEYTGRSTKNDIREHIRYFINLCKKEGRGDSQKQTSLYKVFTGQLAEQIEKELLFYYGQ